VPEPGGGSGTLGTCKRTYLCRKRTPLRLIAVCPESCDPNHVGNLNPDDISLLPKWRAQAVDRMGGTHNCAAQYHPGITTGHTASQIPRGRQKVRFQTLSSRYIWRSSQRKPFHNGASSRLSFLKGATGNAYPDHFVRAQTLYKQEF